MPLTRRQQRKVIPIPQDSVKAGFKMYMSNFFAKGES